MSGAVPDLGATGPATHPASRRAILPGPWRMAGGPTARVA